MVAHLWPAIYTDKNLLLLEIPGAENDPLLGSDSPDLQIRKTLGSITHTDRHIARQLADTHLWVNQIPLRRQLRQTYFASHYGFSADVAACALMGLEALVKEKN